MQVVVFVLRLWYAYIGQGLCITDFVWQQGEFC